MSAQDLERRARELLAEAFSDVGAFSAADTLLGTAYVTDYKNVVALRAIVAALRQQPAPVVDDARMSRALEWLRTNAAFEFPHIREHIPAIEEAIAAYDPNCCARTVRAQGVQS